jgi:hypothetical protein
LLNIVGLLDSASGGVILVEPGNDWLKEKDVLVFVGKYWIYFSKFIDELSVYDNRITVNLQ